MLLVVFLMGLHAAIFSPAKYGIVPGDAGRPRPLARQRAARNEHLRRDRARASRRGGVLFGTGGRRVAHRRSATLAIAVTGFLTSLAHHARAALRRARSRSAGIPSARSPRSTRHLLRDSPLWLAVLGVSYFWFAGVLLKTDLQYFGNDVLHTDDKRRLPALGFLAIGIGCGNMLAGRLSGDKVELGLVPLGACFMGVFALALCAARGSLAASARSRWRCLAMASGLFVVPLYAFMQQRSGAQEKGRVVAANNFYPDHRHAARLGAAAGVCSRPPALSRRLRSCSASASRCCW